MHEYGGKEALAERKMDFMETRFGRGETILAFADRFYMEAQTLFSSRAATFIDAKAALLGALCHHCQLSLAMKASVYGATTVSELVKQLCNFKDDFEPPVPESKSRSKDDLKPKVLLTEHHKDTISPQETRTC